MKLVQHLRTAAAGLGCVHDLYHDLRASSLVSDLDRLVESIPAEYIEREDDVRLFEPPEATDAGTGAYSLSFTRYPNEEPEGAPAGRGRRTLIDAAAVTALYDDE